MNSRIRNQESGIRNLILVLFALCSQLSAKIPEPDAIFFGNVKHNGGVLLVPANSGDFIVVAKLNGVTIAQTSLNALSSQFVLKVPVDDGQEPRLAGMARGNERVRVYLRRTSDNLEVETNESSGSNGLLIPAERGALTEMVSGLSVSTDFGGMAPGYAPFSTWAEGFGIMAYPGSTDSDGDGQTNLQEFVAGTDPTSGGDTFHILEVRRVNGVSSIKFGPAMLSREYSLYCSPDLSGSSWVKIGTIRPNSAAAFQWFDHITPDGTPHLFYKLSVDVR
ncbi:MAG: hypothetical protein JNM99_16935 [Verrucomicrobiaceae bacterium]|nr:hypothetical protein [Verrucomicrobiaceae bacterium]